MCVPKQKKVYISNLWRCKELKLFTVSFILYPWCSMCLSLFIWFFVCWIRDFSFIMEMIQIKLNAGMCSWMWQKEARTHWKPIYESNCFESFEKFEKQRQFTKLRKMKTVARDSKTRDRERNDSLCGKLDVLWAVSARTIIINLKLLKKMKCRYCKKCIPLSENKWFADAFTELML